MKWVLIVLLAWLGLSVVFGIIWHLTKGKLWEIEPRRK